jgi:hypothetical protein
VTAVQQDSQLLLNSSLLLPCFAAIAPTEFEVITQRRIKGRRPIRSSSMPASLRSTSTRTGVASPHISTGCSGDTITTTSVPAAPFTDPVPAERLERAAAALVARNFAVEILDDAAAARARIKDLIPEGASVLTGASETLRRSGIEEDINASGRYDAIRPHGLALDRATQMDEIRRMLASPDVIVGSAAAVTGREHPSRRPGGA